MKLYNTASRKIEEFAPLNPSAVTYYTCGPTVYDVTHIGHMRTYINEDVLKRALNYLDYKVKHVMNITDVGHLTGDDDSGEDKLEKGAAKSGKSVWNVAEEYTKFFFRTMDALNILPADKTIKATDYIPQMIQLIKQLNQKGFAYETEQAIYFDVSIYRNYGKLSGQKLEDKIQQARDEVVADPAKRNPADFALWFKTVGRFEKHQMRWKSPWGEGFPGWHIECSAIAMNELGETIDIHAGGVDHIPTHHENEIAQSEALTGKQFVRFWFHNEFLLVDGKKMSKSLGNYYTIDDVEKRGIDPLALRLLFLQTHYRQQMNFTWESARAAEEAYKKLQDYMIELRKSNGEKKNDNNYREKFRDAVSNDLQMPQAVAVVWEMLKSNIPSSDKLGLLLEFDQVLGLKLSDVQEIVVPKDVQKLLDEREEARAQKDFDKSDELRKKLKELGFTVEDLPSGYKIKKN